MCRTQNATISQDRVVTPINPDIKDEPVSVQACGITKALNVSLTRSSRHANLSTKRIKKTRNNTKKFEETVYYVEAIRSMELRNGQQYYYVKWMGYPEFLNTWEPRSHIRHTPAYAEYTRATQQKTATQ